MNDINTLEESLKKSQEMESNINVSTPTEKGRLKEKIEMLHKKSYIDPYKKITFGALTIRKKDKRKIHADIKQSKLYKQIISMKFVKKSLNI